jgi:hypothetical protein
MQYYCWVRERYTLHQMSYPGQSQSCASPEAPAADPQATKSNDYSRVIETTELKKDDTARRSSLVLANSRGNVAANHNLLKS